MGIRILVVEDEANIADYLARGLREEGFAVDLALDGESALAALRSSTWDLIVLDWSLPDVDGLQVLRLFREQDRRTPVMFLTARDQVADRVAGLNAGADDYLCKPFDFEELIARVHAMLRRRDLDGGASVITWEDVSIDVAHHRGERAGRLLDLTAKESALLAYFLRNPGRVLSRTRIYDSVWGGVVGPSKTLEVHIAELRRKLEAHGPRLIHTIRGRGYIFGKVGDGADEETP